MEIDLYRDWVAFLRSKLSDFGYNVNQLKTQESVVHTYFNLIRRLVRPTPRIVYKAKDFSCPSEHAVGLAEVERKVGVGEDLTFNLSELLCKPSFNDALLNDWGIHHLHLGTSINSKGFVKRTGPVLLARFDNSEAYFIAVLPHGSWNMQRMVRVLHDNWPDSIQRFRLNGVIGLANTILDCHVQSLRKRNVNTMVDLGNGIVYAPIGGGYAMSGLSLKVVTQADKCRERLRQMQQSVINNIMLIAEAARQKDIAFPDAPQFSLQIEGDELYAIEINSLVCARLGKL